MHRLNSEISDTVHLALAAVAQDSGRSIELAAAAELESSLGVDLNELHDLFWTPELLSSLDAAAAEADQGGGISLDEMRAELSARSLAWRKIRLGLNLIVMPSARRDLLRIQDRNAETHGAHHADRYLDFLSEGTAKLEVDWVQGRPVSGLAEMRFVVLRKGWGHGHLAIYRVTTNTVEILRYFYTAQDWLRKAEQSEL